MRSVTSGRAAKVDGRGPWRLTGSFSNAECWFLTKAPRRSALHEGTPIHCTRDASRDIKPGCQDHHLAAIVPRPPPSDPRPTGRGARLLPRLRQRSRRWLSGTVGLPIGAVDRNGVDGRGAVHIRVFVCAGWYNDCLTSLERKRAFRAVEPYD